MTTTATPCPACERAARQVCALFYSTCRQCQARQLSRGPWFLPTVEARRGFAPYRRALGAAGLLDADVVAAADADFEHREKSHG